MTNVTKIPKNNSKKLYTNHQVLNFNQHIKEFEEFWNSPEIIQVRKEKGFIK